MTTRTEKIDAVAVQIFDALYSNTELTFNTGLSPEDTNFAISLAIDDLKHQMALEQHQAQIKVLDKDQAQHDHDRQFRIYRYSGDK